jgi:serpin B
LAGFGAEMLRRVHDGSSPNTALSPYSLATVLAMARAGAKGATGDQLDAALELSGVDAQGAAITAVDDALAAAVKTATERKSDMIIEAANQTWVQSGFDVHQEYLDELARQFGVAAVAADFSADPEAARQAINAWVAERTRTLIPELFGTGTIDASTVLVLVNALYLKAAWAAPFTPNPSTTPFTTAAGSSKPVTLMRAPSPVPGHEGDGWVSAYAGYVGQGLAMTVLVPDDLAATLAALDADLIAEANATSGQYNFQMPGFEVHSTPDVQTAIQAMGVTDLFDEGTVDLSGIAGTKGDLVATSFVHQAVVLVDENGTEAAAATGLGISATGLPQIDGEIVVDKPFLFWIHDTATGAPVFLGVIGDPTATG